MTQTFLTTAFFQVHNLKFPEEAPSSSYSCTYNSIDQNPLPEEERVVDDDAVFPSR